MAEITEQLGALKYRFAKKHEDERLDWLAERAGLEAAVNSLYEQCKALEEMDREKTERYEKVLSQHKMEVALQTETRQIAEREALRAGMELLRLRQLLWREDEKALRDEYYRQKDLEEGEDLPEITDIQVCPACNERQLVHWRGQVYDCLYCGQAFRQAFPEKSMRPKHPWYS